MDFLTTNDRPGIHAPSWYAATANGARDYPALEGEMRCDVCVIGAGYSGLSAAIQLRKSGLSVVLLEANRVGWGASGRNGGQVGSGQRVGQRELEEMVGRDDARHLWTLAQEAKALVRRLIGEGGIDCDLRPGVLDTIHRARFDRECREEVALLNERYGYADLSYVDADEVRALLGTRRYHSGMMDSGAAHLHPLNYAQGLARMADQLGVKIFERSLVTGRKGTTVETERGTIKADQVILACNGYLGGLEQEVAAKVMPINNFILATEPLGSTRARGIINGGFAVADSKFVVNYFRMSADQRLLFGGTETYGYRFPKDIAGNVRRSMLHIYPQLRDVKIDYAWGGTLAITMSRMPYFTRVAPDVLSVSGYSGHGVAIATLAGKLAAEAVAGDASGFDVFTRIPAAKFPGGPRLRSPLLALAMVWYGLRDRL